MKNIDRKRPTVIGEVITQPKAFQAPVKSRPMSGKVVTNRAALNAQNYKQAIQKAIDLKPKD